MMVKNTKARTKVIRIAPVTAKLGIIISLMMTVVVGLAVTTMMVPYLQTAAAISDPNEKSAVRFAPGQVKAFDPQPEPPGSEASARDLAPRAIGDPNEISDPDQIGDPNIRAPGLLKQGEIFPGPE
jgi:hypothetical protein